MFVPNARWALGASWMLLVLAIGVVVGAGSTGILLLLVVAAVAPPLMMLALWEKRPPVTVADVLRDTEEHR